MNAVQLVERLAERLGRPDHRFRLPVAMPGDGPGDANGAEAFAVFTRDDGPLVAGNIALLVALEPDGAEPALWERRRTDLLANVLVTANAGGWLMLLPGGLPDSRQPIPESRVIEEIAARRSELFTPMALLVGGWGQRSFRDLEMAIEPRSFTAILRQQDKLVEAITEAVRQAFLVEAYTRRKSRRGARSLAETEQDVVQVALALVAARTLEDRGQLGRDPTPSASPEAVLGRAIQHVNGFLQRTRDQVLDRLCVEARQVLARELSVNTSFALLDHHHVAELYEGLINLLPKTADEVAKDAALQRHYTPRAVAEKILDQLPLELLRPRDRVVFDPAAGSGTFLRAATRRLGAMADLPEIPIERAKYLREHVIGNDVDRGAKLVFKLMYYMNWGRDPTAAVEPERYLQHNLWSIDAERLSDLCGARPTVFVANPPYVDQKEQAAAKFVRHTLTWMREGDMFGFVLPQGFLPGSSSGYAPARDELFSKCEIYEIWDLPEGAIGLAAEQPTVVVLGRRGLPAARPGTLRRRLMDRGGIDEKVQRSGFVGPAWIDTPSFNGVRIESPTVALDALFYTYIGVNLRLQKYPPVADPTPGVVCKPFPAAAPTQEEPNPKVRWIRYIDESADPQDIRAQRKYLEEPRWRNRDMFAASKLLVSRSSNRDSTDPVRVRLETSGLFPNQDTYCIGDRQTAVALGLSDPTPEVPAAWTALSERERLLWLSGLLQSSVVRSMLLHRRASRHAQIGDFRNLRIPASPDAAIVRLAEEVEHFQQSSRQVPEELRRRLDEAVLLSYGSPFILEHGEGPEKRAYEQMKVEQATASEPVMGQVLGYDPAIERGQIRVRINGLRDDPKVFDIPLPHELPGWLLHRRDVFVAQLSGDVKTIEELRRRPWALRNFRCAGRPYLEPEELRIDREEEPS